MQRCGKNLNGEFTLTNPPNLRKLAEALTFKSSTTNPANENPVLPQQAHFKSHRLSRKQSAQASVSTEKQQGFNNLPWKLLIYHLNSNILSFHLRLQKRPNPNEESETPIFFFIHPSLSYAHTYKEQKIKKTELSS